MMTRRAFTLIEIMVALAAGAVITTAAVAGLSHVTAFQAEAVARNNAARDAELVADILGKDLVFAGVGVPRGVRLDDADFPAPIEDHQLRPLFRIAKPDHFAFVGDLPYPNADLNGFVRVADLNGATGHRPAVTSDLSGCVPPSGSPASYVCTTTTQSLLGPLPGTNCSASNPNARTCPWGLNKWQSSTNNVHLVFGTATGGWYEREWDVATPNTASVGPFVALHLEHEHGDGTSFGSSGNEDMDRALLLEPTGSGFASQIDRVFWSFEGVAAGTACGSPPNCVLRRRQCWGQVVDPGNANWPKVQNGNFRSNSTPQHCTGAADGTGWETIITGVRSFAVTYRDGADLALDTASWDLAKSALVKSVEVEIVVDRRVNGTNRIVTHRSKKRFFIENRGGLTGLPPASGGCSGGDEGGCGGDEG